MVVVYVICALIGAFLLWVLFLSICAALVDTKRYYEKDSPFYRWVLDSATWAILTGLRIRVHVTGREQLPVGQRLLFVGNHRSNYDPIVTWYAFRPWRMSYISKVENFKIPIFGRIIRRCCFMDIDRQDPRKAIVTIVRAARLLKAQEVSIGVYPEGTRCKTGGMLPFHNGVFKIAQKSDVPIAVVSVVGTETIHARTPFRTSHVYVDVVALIDPETVKNSKTEVLGEMVRSALEENIEKRKT